ncbi:Tad domain-containing protein [Lignipirellula cremea]|uniref:Putative Flp pilus-assembly TadG-like N-terminal domain-containing protein n=1 Tax=Lignipirellula cremea TaxID=2528010 RepID=A0A518E1S7_9BACT|nr:Tad domain-containing protein [Lignipirellula cremea]QDU98023.1 hypothetical protein Pla8534_58840 [Lignipirellula cremea]
MRNHFHPRNLQRCLGFCFSRGAGLIGRVHGDEKGSISLTSMFGLITLTILLGMVMNSDLQFNEKVRMQNAADAAAYSGGVSIARSLNTIAFSNHLLWDTFALTAYLREARDQTAITLTPEILANWTRIGPAFAGSEFQKFADLGEAINEKAPGEMQLVATFGAWSQASSELMLPVFEQILAEEQIPEFQRAVLQASPQQAQMAAEEAAQRHGRAWPRAVDLHALMWRTNVDPMGGDRESELRTLPVWDYREHGKIDQARTFRRQFAHTYLHQWDAASMQPFDNLLLGGGWRTGLGKMSQYAAFWRILTAGHLEQLLEEYPDTNLMFMLRRPWEYGDTELSQLAINQMYDRDFMFVGVVYRSKFTELMPRVFRSPAAGDTQAYAQVMVTVPRRRLLKVEPGENAVTAGLTGGVPGQYVDLPADVDPPPEDPEVEQQDWYITRQPGSWFPEEFSMRNQNWSVQLAPATSASIPAILSSQPYTHPSLGDFTPPDFRDLEANDLDWLSHH